MLFEGGFGSFEKESVYTFIEVLACHIVVNYSESVYEDGSPIFGIDMVLDLGQLALLLDDFNGLSTVLSGFCCLLAADNWLDKLIFCWLVENSLLFSDGRESFLGRRRC